MRSVTASGRRTRLECSATPGEITKSGRPPTSLLPPDPTSSTAHPPGRGSGVGVLTVVAGANREDHARQPHHGVAARGSANALRRRTRRVRDEIHGSGSADGSEIIEYERRSRPPPHLARFLLRRHPADAGRSSFSGGERLPRRETAQSRAHASRRPANDLVTVTLRVLEEPFGVSEPSSAIASSSTGSRHIIRLATGARGTWVPRRTPPARTRAVAMARRRPSKYRKRRAPARASAACGAAPASHPLCARCRECPQRVCPGPSCVHSRRISTLRSPPGLANGPRSARPRRAADRAPGASERTWPQPSQMARREHGRTGELQAGEHRRRARAVPPARCSRRRRRG